VPEWRTPVPAQPAVGGWRSTSPIWLALPIVPLIPISANSSISERSPMFQHPQTRAAIAVSLGAIVGALCRYYLGLGLTHLISPNFPAGTLIVNLLGCFLMGAIVTMAVKDLFSHPDLLLLLTTGFLGSLTTFSSYELDTVELLEDKKFLISFLYWAGSPLLGLLSVTLGISLAKRLKPMS